MPPDPAAADALAVDLRTFSSAAEALARQDYFLGTPFAPDQPSLLIWQSPRALLAAPADARLPQFQERARRCAEIGWPVAVRRGGGGLCPVSAGTLQLAISRPVAAGVTIESGYEEMATLVEALLGRFGLTGQRGICPDAFCPGRYDIAVAGRKIAGLAQSWRSRRGQRTATTGASVIFDEAGTELARAVNLFYRGTSNAPVKADAIGSISHAMHRPVTPKEILEGLRSLVPAQSLTG
ncbi:lipoyl protein ligase domain-containing protein [Actibacterium sp. D379-3]